MVLKFVLLKARELMLSAAEVVPTLALGVLWYVSVEGAVVTGSPTDGVTSAAKPLPLVNAVTLPAVGAAPGATAAELEPPPLLEHGTGGPAELPLLGGHKVTTEGIGPFAP
jgi:hypothetical protein